MIQIDNLTFLYEQEMKNNGVFHISFHVPKGNCAILCGPSGCGKTTLLRLVNGLAPNVYPGKLSGNVKVNGQEPCSMTSQEKAMTFGMVFQDPRSQFFMSNVQEEIAFSGENMGLLPNKILKRIEHLASRLGLDDLLSRELNHLSSGQKQKVAIAAACLLNPPLLILDEPTANLDKAGTQTLIEILTEIKRGGTTILISEHRLHCFLPVADDYICLKDGRITASFSNHEFSCLSCEEAEEHGLRHPDSGIVTSQKAEMPEQEILFSVINIAFKYEKNVPLLKAPDFPIMKGCITAVTGENGAGKTTLGKILSGLIQEKKGRILCKGRPISAGKRCRRSYFVMQDPDYQLYSESVGNELVLGRKVTNALRSKAYEAMELFDLTKYKDRHPASLSGGEKQRVTLAAAYCSDAELIILDEPTSGLDVMNAKRVSKFIKILAQENKAVVVITHDELLLRLACDRVIQMG